MQRYMPPFVSCALISLIALSNINAARCQSFSATGALPVPLWGQTATLLKDGTVLVAGGDTTSSPSGATSNAYIYDPVSKTFTQTGAMSTPRISHTAVLLPNGRVLIAGGMNASATILSTAEVYNPVSKSFSTTGNMTAPRWNPTGTLLSNGQVLIAGGGTTSIVQGTNTAEMYNPASGEFAATGSMITGRLDQTATRLYDGSVLMAGGEGLVGGYLSGLNSAERFVPASNISSGQFTPVGNMTTYRYAHTATLLTDGTVLIAGGYFMYENIQSSAGELNSAEIYNPSTLSFSPTGNLNIARSFHTATALYDGTVLIAGGCTGKDSCNPTNAAEIYIPSSHSFSQTGTMTSVRDSHASTLLSDGTVLITGGRTTSADLYSYPFSKGSLVPKYVVLGVLYSPPGAKSSVSYNQSTALGTSSSISGTLSSSEKVSATLGLTGYLTDMGSNTWTQTTDTTSSYSVNKTATSGIGISGPLSSAIGVDHDYDEVLVWLNPLANLSVGPITTNLLWNGYSFNPQDVYFQGSPDIVALSIFCLKNPFLGTNPNPNLNTQCAANSYLTSRSWDTAYGLGGLSLSDFATIAARDPFFKSNNGAVVDNSSYDPNNDQTNRFTNTGEIVYFQPAAPGDGPITTPGSLTYQEIASAGQTATDTYASEMALSASLKNIISLSNSTTWTNKWSTTETATVGQTASYSVTSPVATDNYAGPTSFQVWQDNVYGTFMFVAPGTTPASPGSIGTSPASINFGSVAVGYTSNPVQVALKNNSTVPMFMGVSSVFPFTSTSTWLAPVAAFSDPRFAVQVDSCTGKIIPTGGTCAISLTFTPLSSDSPGSGVTINGTMYATGETNAAVLGTVNLTGTIIPPAAFTVTATNPSQTTPLSLGHSMNYTINVSPQNGFSGPVALSVSGLPAGVTGQLSSSYVNTSGAVTLTITAAYSNSTHIGNSTVTITGSNGGSSNSAVFALATQPLQYRGSCGVQ